MTISLPIIEEIGKTFSEWYTMWYNASRTLLKYPQEIISFVDSCNFTCEQLQRIARALEELKWSDYDEGETIEDQFDRQEAQNGQY